MIEAINAVNTVSELNNVNIFEKNDVPTANQAPFTDLLSSGVQNIQNDISASEKLLNDYILNKNVSTHDLMISMQKAKMSMQFSVEVRNKLVEAYQQVTRMQV